MIYLAYVAVFFIFYLLTKMQVFLLYAATAVISATLSLFIPEPYIGIMYSIAIMANVIWFYKIKK